MRTKHAIIGVAILSLFAGSIDAAALTTQAGAASDFNYKPQEGYVGTARIAIQIAEAVLRPIYGARLIANEEPLTAVLTNDDIWIVRGSLRKARSWPSVGGVAEIWISKSDGRILKVIHGE